jgi:CHC2 zinc finger
MRTALAEHERDIAQATLRRFSTGDLSPEELAIESERWEREVRVLKADLVAGDMHDDEATTRAGIAYAEHRLEQITRQLDRFSRAGIHQRRELKNDFQAAKYVDLVGLAETLLSEPARRCGRDRYRIRCPFHDDRAPSLLIYPPGEGWWCPVCGKGGQDAASFCAEYFHCSQLEGLRWVQQLTDVAGAA